VFSPAAPDEAGEASAEGGGLSGGTRQSQFAAEWDFTSAQPAAEQPGLGITASPDRGDGARMSWVRMEDHADGLAVLFNDYQRNGNTACESPADFVQTEIASGLDRGTAHHVEVVMDFVAGAANDVVKVYVDGSLAHTGTSWEDYFRDCEGNPTRTVDSLLFRSSGTAQPANAGKGFLIDNLSAETRSLAVPDAPANLTATESTSTVDVDWDAPAGDGGSPITGYTVYRDGNAIGTTDAGTTSFQDTSAPASSQAHTYKVTAENAVGSSADSNTDTAIVDLTWKGQLWDVVNGTAVVNGEGGVDLTRLSGGESSLHLVGDAPVNADGTPWVRFETTTTTAPPGRASTCSSTLRRTPATIPASRRARCSAAAASATPATPSPRSSRSCTRPTTTPASDPGPTRTTRSTWASARTAPSTTWPTGTGTPPPS
jgi:hypothetical protein